MKTFVKYILQKSLGLNRYLYIFSLFVIVKIRWDKKEKDFFHFLELIPDNGIALDLGANIGVTSYHLAKKLPGSIIYSFEPLSINMNILKRIKRKFGLNNIREIQMAVGNNNGTIDMVMPVIKDVPMHGLSHVIDNETMENNEGFKYTVPITRLDNCKEIVIDENRVTALKIDVENFEYFVLKGGENLIRKNKPIIYCELWDNENRKKCFSFLNKLGYNTFVLNKKELIPAEKSGIEKHNFFFIPKSN